MYAESSGSQPPHLGTPRHPPAAPPPAGLQNLSTKTEKALRLLFPTRFLYLSCAAQHKPAVSSYLEQHHHTWLGHGAARRAPPRPGGEKELTPDLDGGLNANWEEIFLPGTQIGATEEVCLQPTGQHRLSAASGGVAMHQQVHEQHRGGCSARRQDLFRIPTGCERQTLNINIYTLLFSMTP